MAGCGAGSGGSSSGSNSAAPAISVSISPSNPSPISAGGTQVFTATVTNDSTNAGVTWGATVGSISATGMYTAPSLVTVSSTTVIATSKADPTKSTSISVPLIENNGLSLAAISPATASLGIAGSQAFTDSVLNDPTNSGVTWSIGSGPGSLSSVTSTGVTYNAPSTPISSATTVTLTATSAKDTTKTTTAAITLNPILISVVPTGSSMAGGATQSITANVANDGENQGVTWSATGGGSFSSTTTQSGTATQYTAPTPASSGTVTVTATSKTDPTRSSSVVIAISPAISVNPITPGSASLGIGGSQSFSASVNNDPSNSGVSWSLSYGPGSLSAATTTSVTYNAPATPVGAGSYAILTATSVKDPTKSAAVTINLTPVAVTLTSASALTLDGDGMDAATISASITGDNNASGASFTVSGAGGTMSSSPVSGNSPSSVYTAPVVASATSSTITVASVADPSKTQSVAVTLNPPMTFTTTPGALANGSNGVAYSSTIGVSGGTGAKTFSIPTGSLPAGLMISSTTGVISGTPTGTAGTSTFTVQVMDQASTPGILKGTFTITIQPLVWSSPSAGTFTYSVGTAITPIPLSATGGAGTITYSVNSGTLPQGLQIVGNQVTGTPTVTTTGTPITFLATDSSTPSPETAVSATVTLIVNPSAVLALPSPNPASLGTAGINLAYSGSINATGGIGGYTWTVNGTSVPTNGTAVPLSDSLSVSNNGSATLVVSGTPTATGSVPLIAAVKDSTNATAGPITYNLNVSNVYTVGGGISLPACSPSPYSFSGITINLYTSPLQQPLQQPLQTATTQADGSFSFANIPNGTYVLVPSAANAVFSPATENVTVSGGNLSAGSFTATLGYSISGTVSYGGTNYQSGQHTIYLAAIPGNNCYIGSTGTSISAPGTFTINGVPPGTYTLQAFMDTGPNGGNGVPNAQNPVGSTPGVTVATSDISGVSLTLNDPAAVTLSTSPTLKQVSGFNNGALTEYTPITNSDGVETAAYYTLQWSTSSSDFTNPAGTKQFPANGTHNNIWLLNGLTNGSVYYFRAYGTSGGTPQGPPSPIFGPVTISAPTTGDVVTGSVNFAATQTGPMYTGFLDQGTGAFYGQYFAAPSNTQPYSIQVPEGSDYLFLGIVDQNNDGVVDANDVTNTGNGSVQPIVTVSGPVSGNDLTLPSTDGIATVTTQSIQTITSSGTTQSYTLNFNINGLIKQPVAVTLVSGPNLITPVDIAICGGSGSNCSQGFQISFNLNSTSPNVGDTYTFDVTYSDGTTGALSASVTAVLSAYATGLAPQTGLSTSATPTFTWTDPANASSYAYQFLLTDPNGNTVWQIPGNSTASKGFSSSITSIPWGTDPTGGGSTPTVGSLTLNSLYSWQIGVEDSYGNEAITQVQYQP